MICRPWTFQDWSQSVQEVLVNRRQEPVQSLFGVKTMVKVMQVHQQGKGRGQLQIRNNRIQIQCKLIL